MASDYYEILGVSRDASSEQIQQAFRTLARKYHPDVNPDPAAADRFKEINEAYHVLSDPDTRKRYDRFGADFRRIPEDYDERVGAGVGGFRAGGPSGPRVRYGQGFGGESGINIEDLFGDLFGGSGGFGGGFGPIPGADQQADIELTVEEAYRGGRRQIALDGRDITTDLPLSPWEAALGASVAVHTPGGEAKLKVPPGSSTGRRLRLRGQGMPNRRGKPGDLYAEVKIMVPAKPTERERKLFEQLAAESTFDPRRGR